MSPRVDGRKIVIAIEDVAAGHRVPAIAIQEAIESLHPGQFEIEIVDFLKYRDPSPLPGGSEGSVRVTSTNNFLNSVNSAFWHLSNSRLFHPYERHFIQKRCGNHYRDLIKRKAPNLLISVHPYLSELLGSWREDLSFQHAAIVLELGTPMRSSATDTFDLLVCPTELAAQRLRRMGTPDTKIVKGLFPFQSGLSSARSRSEMANELGLNPAKPILLLTGGGVSTASVAKHLDSLDLRHFQIVVLSGKDERFTETLRQNYVENETVRIVRFTNRIMDFYALADLVIAKPGASTVMEMELLSKRCLLTSPAGPQENGNVEYALQSPNFRYIGRSSRHFDTIIEDMLVSPPTSDSRRRQEETEELATRCLSLIR